MRRVAPLLVILLVVLLAVPVTAQQQGSGYEGIDALARYFRDTYGNAEVNPALDTPPARPAADAEALSPFGGASGLPTDLTDAIKIDGVLNFDLNLGVPTLVDGDAYEQALQGWVGDEGFGLRPLPLPERGWVPPSRAAEFVWQELERKAADGLSSADQAQRGLGGGVSVVTPAPEAVRTDFFAPMYIGDSLDMSLDRLAEMDRAGSAVSPWEASVIGDLFLFGGDVTEYSDKRFNVRGGIGGGIMPFDESCGGNILELGWGVALDGRPQWEPADFAPNDLFGGLSVAWVLNCQPGLGWDLLKFENTGSFFELAQTAATGLVGDGYWAVAVPKDEIVGMTGARTFQFLTPGDDPYQPDTTAFFSDPAYPALSTEMAPLITFDPFLTESLAGSHTLDLSLTATTNSACGVFAEEFHSVFQVAAPLGGGGGTTAPVHAYDVGSGMTFTGTASQDGELGFRFTNADGTVGLHFEGRDVDLTYSTDGYGDCSWAGSVVGGYDDLSSFMGTYLVAEATDTTTTSAPDETSSTEAPVEDTSPPTTLPGGGNLESGSFREWVPLIFVFGGLALFVGGFWVYYRTRERTPGGATGGKEDPPPPELPGGMAPPPTPATGDGADDHGSCDWSMYFNGNLIRPAKGHECCRYELSITTDALEYELVSKGRQDGKNPHGEDASPDGRMRLFDYDLQASGIDMLGWAASRTGPAGRQDWMHGLGDPQFRAGWRSTDEGEQHPQERTLEEPVDAGVSVRYHLETTVHAEFKPGCGDTDSHYDLEGSSDIWMDASAECTNGAPGPECPVEASTSGFVDASMSGDLDIPNVLKAATFPDELERTSPKGLEGPIGGIDSHDHATRPRIEWADDRSASASNHVDGNVSATTLTSRISLDSGQIVPVEAWDTTERVTTDVAGELELAFDMDAHVDVNACGDGCEGHGECDCTPSFSLRIVGGKGTITVDGEAIDIERIMFGNDWVRS